MAIIVPIKLLLDDAKKQFGTFTDELSRKTEGVRGKFAQVANEIDKAKQLQGKIKDGVEVVNGALDAGSAILKRYPQYFGETGKAIADAVPKLKETVTQTGDWAVKGAMIGSVIPGIGTVTGAIAGATASIALSVWDWYNGTKSTSEEQAELNKQIAIANKLKEEADKKAEQAYDRMKKEKQDFSANLQKEFLSGIKETFEKSNQDPPTVKVKVRLTDQNEQDILESFARDMITLRNIAAGPSAEAPAFAGAAESFMGRKPKTKNSGLQRPDIIPGLASMGAATAEIDPLKAAIQDLFGIITSEGSAAEQALNGVTSGLYRVGDAVAKGFGSAATGAVSDLFDAMAAGEKISEGLIKSFERRAAASLRATGSELIGDGIANEMRALAMAFIPSQRANAAGLAIAGAAEIAEGIALGGAGVALGRRAGPAPSGGDGGSMGGGAGGADSNRFSDPGPQQMAPIVVNFNSTVPATERGAQEQAAMIEKILASKKGGRR